MHIVLCAPGEKEGTAYDLSSVDHCMVRSHRLTALEVG